MNQGLPQIMSPGKPERADLGSAKQESQPEMLQPAGYRTPSFSPLLPRQNSILSLTFGEIQHKSGKNLGSMNMDEFLANLCTVEENRLPSSFHADRTAPCDDKVDILPALPHQGSLSLPAPLCKKTVDEVWLEIQKGRQDVYGEATGTTSDVEPQQTFGEITLEDFLIKAGIVQEPLKGTLVHNSNNDYQYHMNGMGMGQRVEMQGFCGQTSGGMAGGYAATYPVIARGKDIVGQASTSDEKSRHLSADLDGFKFKRRIIDGPPEVLLERRQRRMIKNRESAARSRARKQAYTVELELELNQLMEENLRLKKIVEENEKRRRQEMMKRKPQVTTGKKVDKLRKMRRIVSMIW